MKKPIILYNLTLRTAYKLDKKMKKIEKIKVWFKCLFTDQQWEAFKSILRIVIFYVSSDIVTQLLNQAVAVPEKILIPVWVFVFTIPARMLFVGGLTLGLSYVDKLRHLNFKEAHPQSEKTGGILPL